MGGRDWRKRFISGFPMIGHLAETGAYPVNAGTEEPISSRELFAGASARAKCFWVGEKVFGEAFKLWGEALAHC